MGIDLLHVGRPAARRGCAAPRPRRARRCGPKPSPEASSARSGSAMIRPTWPISASWATSPSGRSSTDTAPSRFRATVRASALGRGPINTPTCSPWRTPISISPRTTLSIRSLISAGAVGAVLEQEEDVVGRPSHALGDEQAERDPGVGLDLLQAGQPRQLPGRLAGQLAHPPRGAPGRADHRAGDPGAHRAGQLHAVADPPPDTGLELLLGIVGHLAEPVGPLALAVAPAGPAGHRRPGGAVRLGADDETEVAGLQGQLVDLGAGRGLADRAHPRGRGDLVHRADDRQDRAVDVGQGQQPVIDDEAALEHPVVGDELVHEVGQGGPGPRHPAVGLEKAPLTLAGQQRLAVVQLHDELQAAARRLDRVEHAKARAAEPGRHLPASEHVVGQHGGQAPGELLRQPERHPQPRVDGTAEGDQRGQPLAPPVGGGLVAEHAALAVAGQMHVAAGGALHPVHRIGDRDHVVGQRALKASLLAFGGAEVHHPRVGAVFVQQGDRARGRGDVVDLGGEHHRGDEQDRRARRAGSGSALGPRAPVGARPALGVVVAQPVDPVLGGDLVGRRLLAGGQAPEAGDLERILRGRAEAGDRRGDRLGQEIHCGRHHPRSSPGPLLSRRRDEHAEPGNGQAGARRPRGPDRARPARRAERVDPPARARDDRGPGRGR